jgi:hypothetical protein
MVTHPGRRQTTGTVLGDGTGMTSVGTSGTAFDGMTSDRGAAAESERRATPVRNGTVPEDRHHSEVAPAGAGCIGT